MNKLLTNARLIDPFGVNEFIENGYILVENETIVKIGSGTAPDISADEIIDLAGKTILPGMINAHTHLYSALATGMPPPKNAPQNFVQKLQEIWWILDLALDKDATKASFEVGLLDCLRNGVTTVFDHHSSPNFTDGSLQLLVDSAEMFGQNISIAFETTDRNGKEFFKSGLNENIRAFEKFHNKKHVYPLIGLHASFTLSDESLKTIYNEIKDLKNWGIHIHVAEDNADEKDTQSIGYKSVIDRLNKFSLINENSFIIHGIHSSNEDIELLNKANATLIHNPTSNANNRVGILSNSHISTMHSGLGTDGMRANMLEEAQQGTLIRSSHLRGGESSVNYLELLFKNNSQIATKCFGRPIGHLSAGNQADLAIFDYQPKTAMTNDNFLSHILFGFGQPSDIITRGKYRIKNRKFMTVPEMEIKQNARIQSVELWNKMQNI